MQCKALYSGPWPLGTTVQRTADQHHSCLKGSKPMRGSRARKQNNTSEQPKPTTCS